MSDFLFNLAARTLGKAEVVRPRLAPMFAAGRAAPFEMADEPDEQSVPSGRALADPEPYAIRAKDRAREAEAGAQATQDARSDRAAPVDLHEALPLVSGDEPSVDETRPGAMPLSMRELPRAMPESVEPEPVDGVPYPSADRHDGAAPAGPSQPVVRRLQEQYAATEPMALPLPGRNSTSPFARPSADADSDGVAYDPSRHDGAASKSTHLPVAARSDHGHGRDAPDSRGRALSLDERASEDDAVPVPVTRSIETNPAFESPPDPYRATSHQKPFVPLARRSADSVPPQQRTAPVRDRPGAAMRSQKSAEQTVHVTIGRVEIRATPAPTNLGTKTARSSHEPTSLDRYLKNRAAGSGS
ncbi:hypothetical protein F6X40_12775 [Paraburkholderia sp. UCT31]|uniref:hypothetical protein n=1 Tax=Paraburkholderia sp. UCT31 TaxID=2615209 RepID=UPI00165534EA|nr:hypothetical protein [Paraburkholderia sp. UCT31]MBC8737673.1 hypothetical protein [Paraburkholderia sp. UCT31]